MKIVSLFTVLLMCSSTFAGLVDVQKSTTQKIGGVAVAETGVAMIDGQAVNLTTVSAGLRKKYVILGIGTSVYVAQVMVAQPELYTKSMEGSVTLDSLEQQTAMAVRLDFVYNPTADQLYNAFTDALKANQVDLTSVEISTFLNNVKSGANPTNGKAMTLLMVKNAEGSEKISYEDADGQMTEVQGVAGFSKNIMSMWLGKIASGDKGLQELKQQLLK